MSGKTKEKFKNKFYVNVKRKERKKGLDTKITNTPNKKTHGQRTKVQEGSSLEKPNLDWLLK